MKSTNLEKDLGRDICGLELFVFEGEAVVCGKPGVIWGLVNLPGWENSQIVGCNEHVSVLYDNPDVNVTSDAPFYGDECICD